MSTIFTATGGFNLPQFKVGEDLVEWWSRLQTQLLVIDSRYWSLVAFRVLGLCKPIEEILMAEDQRRRQDGQVVRARRAATVLVTRGTSARDAWTPGSGCHANGGGIAVLLAQDGRRH